MRRKTTIVLVIVAAAMVTAAALWSQPGPESASAAGTSFQMNFLVKAPSGICDSDTNPTTCDLPLGAKFTLSVEVIDPPTPYQGVQTDIRYGGLTYQPTVFGIDEIVWPDVLGFARSPSSPTGTEGFVLSFANTSSQAPFVPSSYVGAVVQISLRCTNSMSSTAVRLATSLDTPGASSTLDVISGPSVIVVTPKTVATETADMLTINCLSALPTYTPAPATATPTPSPTPIAPSEPAGMDLAIKSGGACDSTEKPTACSVLIGSSFDLGVVTNDRPAGGYLALQTRVELDGLAYKPATFAAEEIPWPDCALPLRIQLASPDRLLHACLTAGSPPFPISTYSGNIVRFTLTCPTTPGIHVLRLVPYTAEAPSGSGYKRGNEPVIPASDTLTINCVAVLPTPTPAPPTPVPVGGVSFAPPSVGANSAFDTAATAALVTGIALAATAWYARRRLR